MDLTLDEQPWQIGLVVGPSGSGKSTLAREAFPDALVSGYDWHPTRAIVDSFDELSIRETTAALSSVGFSSAPNWLRPFHVLSNGEQFRATMARALVDPSPRSDRRVHQRGRPAGRPDRFGRGGEGGARQPGRRGFVAVTCHADVEEWLCPDWVVEMPAGTFTWRLLRRRPPIELEVARVETEAWHLLRHHHYLDTSLNKTAKCFVAFWRGRPVAFASAIHSPAPPLVLARAPDRVPARLPGRRHRQRGLGVRGRGDEVPGQAVHEHDRQPGDDPARTAPPRSGR